MVFDLGGEDFGFEFGERFLDERIVLEGFHRIGFRLRFGLFARELFHDEARTCFGLDGE